MIAFSPNDVVGIANTGTTALGVTRQDPDLVRSIIRFAMLNDGNLRRYYLGRSGRPAHESWAAVCEYAVLLRLAVAVNDARRESPAQPHTGAVALGRRPPRAL